MSFPFAIGVIIRIIIGVVIPYCTANYKSSVLQVHLAKLRIAVGTVIKNTIKLCAPLVCAFVRQSQ